VKFFGSVQIGVRIPSVEQRPPTLFEHEFLDLGPVFDGPLRLSQAAPHDFTEPLDGSDLVAGRVVQAFDFGNQSSDFLQLVRFESGDHDFRIAGQVESPLDEDDGFFRSDFQFHCGDIIEKGRLVVKPPHWVCLGVPAAIVFTVFGDLIGEVSALETEVPGLTVGAPLESPEGFRVCGGISTAPLRTVQERILGGLHGVTHETAGTRNRSATDFPNVNTLGSDSGDLEVIDVRLVVTPRHTEEITDLDVDGRSNRVVHCGDSLGDSLKKVKRSSRKLRKRDGIGLDRPESPGPSYGLSTVCCSGIQGKGSCESSGNLLPSSGSIDGVPVDSSWKSAVVLPVRQSVFVY